MGERIRKKSAKRIREEEVIAEKLLDVKEDIRTVTGNFKVTFTYFYILLDTLHIKF